MVILAIRPPGTLYLNLLASLGASSPSSLTIFPKTVSVPLNSDRISANPWHEYLPPGWVIRRWENLSKKDPPVCPSANTKRKMINKCVDFITLNTNCGVVLQSLISKKFSYISGLTHRYVLQARPLWNPLDVQWWLKWSIRSAVFYSCFEGCSDFGRE